MKRSILILLAAVPGWIAAQNTSTARVQIINNSADLGMASIDVYIDYSKVADDLDFRTATPFMTLYTDSLMRFTIAPANSESIADSLYSFNLEIIPNRKYVFVACGIHSAVGYNPFVPYRLFTDSLARDNAGMIGRTDVQFFHGCTDLPTINIYEPVIGVVADKLRMGQFNGYTQFTPANYDLQVLSSKDSSFIGAYQLPLMHWGLQDSAVVVLASGFSDPTLNSNGMPFGLWLAYSGGGPLDQLPMSTNIDDPFSIASVFVYPNPANDILNLNMRLRQRERITMDIYNMQGQQVWGQAMGDMIAGAHVLNFDVSALTPGIYTFVISSQTKKVIRKLEVARQ